MKMSILSFPWLSVVCVGLAYGLLGWELSALAAFWLIDLWLGTVVVIFTLIWRGSAVSRLLFRSGPRSLVTILMLSMIMTLSVAYAQPFGLALMLMLTILLGRLELQTGGLDRRVVLTILSIVAGSGLTIGWCLGREVTLMQLWRSLPQ
jgi:hypothetical protein